MRKIVIDLEWNQPLAGRTRAAGLYGEIIQIGAAIIDDNFNVLDTFDQIVKPVRYKRINKDISKLTLLTDADLETGISFAAAADKFRKWCGDDFVFISWGPDDYTMLLNNLEYFDLDASWLPKTFDGQLMFDDMEMQEGKQWALNYGLYHFHEKPNGAHNALADVLSTILVLKHLDLYDGLTDEYFRCDYIDEEEETSDCPHN